MQYSFLNEPFWEWQKSYRHNWILERKRLEEELTEIDLKAFLGRFNQEGAFDGIESENDFEERFIDPFIGFRKDVSRELLELLAAYLTKSCASNVSEQGSVFEVIVRPAPLFCYLSWTVAQIAAIAEKNLPGLIYPGRLIEGTNIDSYIFRFHGMPYKQCLYCGTYLENAQQRKKDNWWFCHIDDACQWIPDFHPEGCCFGDWRRLKQRFLKKIQSRKLEQEAIKVFLEFCEELYQVNEAKIQNPIRPKLGEKSRWEIIQSKKPNAEDGFIKYSKENTY